MKTFTRKIIIFSLALISTVVLTAQTLTINHETAGNLAEEMNTALSGAGLSNVTEVQTLIINGVNLNMTDAVAIKSCTNATTIDVSGISFFNNVMDGNDASGLFGLMTKLQTVILPNSLLQIGKGAFRGCTALESVLIKNEDTTTSNLFSNANTQITLINSMAFFGCTKLAATELPSSVNNIGKQAFQGCTLLNIKNIPGFTNTKLQESLFRESGLTDFTIPQSVTSIDKTVFYTTDASLSRVFTSRNVAPAVPSSATDKRNVFGSDVTIQNTTLKVLKKHQNSYTAWGIANLNIQTLSQDITADITGNGTVTVEGEGLITNAGTVSNGSTVKAYEAETISFTITPDENYVLGTATLDGVVITSAQLLTIDSKSAKELVVTFTEKPKPIQTITIAITGQGTVNVAGEGLVTPAGEVTNGSEVKAFEESIITFTFTPAEKYNLGVVTLDGVSITSGQEITIDTKPEKTLSVTFTEKPKPIQTITANITGQGTVTVSGEGLATPAGEVTNGTEVKAKEESTITFTFTPSANYKLGTTTLDGVAITSGQEITIDEKSAKELTVIFVEKPIQTITTNITGEGNVSVTGELISKAGNLANGDEVKAYERNDIIFTFTASADYELSTATLDGVAITSGQQITIDDKEEKVLSVIFTEKPKPVQTITVNITGKGTVTVTGEGLLTPAGEVANGAQVKAYQQSKVIFTFTPAEAYELSTATLGNATINSAQEITIDNQSEKSLAVTFTIKPVVGINPVISDKDIVYDSNTLRILGTPQTEIRLFDSNGHQILQTIETTIDISSFNSGMYILNVEQKTFKIIKR